jgi:hypothetical protein
MPPRRAPGGEAAARRAAAELVAAAAAEPAAPSGAAAAGRGGATTSAGASPRAGAPRPRVSAALAALRDTLEGVSPAGAAEALGVEGLLAALLREAAAPPGPDAIAAASCLLAIHSAADSDGYPDRSGQRAAAAALFAAAQRDPACLFDAMGRVAAMQAAARSAGGAAFAGAAPPPASSTPPGAAAAAAAAADAADATPGLQLFALLRLADHLLVRGCGPGDGSALAKAFARSAAAVDATIEVLLHGCPGS